MYICKQQVFNACIKKYSDIVESFEQCVPYIPSEMFSDDNGFYCKILVFHFLW